MSDSSLEWHGDERFAERRGCFDSSNVSLDNGHVQAANDLKEMRYMLWSYAHQGTQHLVQSVSGLQILDTDKRLVDILTQLKLSFDDK